MLSRDQIQQYNEDGFLLLPELVPDNILATLNEQFLDIVNGDHPMQWRHENYARRHGG